MICTNDECPDWTVLGTRGEYRQGVTECPRCGAHLVEQFAGEPDGTADDPSATDAPSDLIASPVVVARLNQRHEAELLRGVLAAHGIPATVNSDDCGTTDPALGFGREVQLLVDEDDSQRALAIMADEPSDEK